ncbi:MAG: hypothetical protein GY826_07680 [Fuerstiella sp.]|nr:hypothetical protein [Fuerstiella sp.]
MSESSMSKLPEDQLPQEVVAEFHKQSAVPISVPDTLDEAILRDARSVLLNAATMRQVQPVRRKWSVGLLSVGSLAAALLIAMSSQWNARELRPQPARSVTEYEASDDQSESGRSTSRSVATAFQKEDFDQNGSVDILDAFALARQVRQSDADLATGDQNGDGVVNDVDIELIAMNAVML